MNPLAATTRLVRRHTDGAGYVVQLLLRTALVTPRLHRRLRFLLDNAFNAGVRALPVTAIVAAFAGAILAMQTGIELRRFGDTAVLGTITALSMCREMGPFITGVILAATVRGLQRLRVMDCKLKVHLKKLLTKALKILSPRYINAFVRP